MSGGLSWKYHAIIQSLLSRGPLKEKDLHSMFEDLTKKNPVVDHQYDGQVYYGVVNTVSDEQSKLGTNYTVPQIAFYKAIIEAIVQDSTANGVVSNIAALNFSLDSQMCLASKSNKKVTIVPNPQSQGSQPHVPSALKYFSLTEKEKTLHELVKDHWLYLTTDGNIKLGVKSFLDLRSWFRNNDVPSCQVCNEAGVKVELCQNENCTVRIHHYCVKQLFSQRKVAKVCPSCGTSWPYTVTKAEAVQNEDDDEPRGSQRATGSKEKRRRANRIIEDEVVGCSNNGELNEGTGSQHGNELARKRSRARRNIDDDANIAGSDASQSLRRVTRSSARLM